MINEDNWYYEFYSFQDVKSKIFLGMNSEGQEYYMVSFMKDEVPLKETLFFHSHEAYDFINNECQSWNFSGVTLEGCSTCKAH